MDGLPKIAFLFGNLSSDASALADPWEVYLRLVGDFEMRVSGETIYSERQFCLVEFAIESQIWSRAAVLNPEDFTYTSMEAEESGLVWFRREQDEWRVGSAFQRHPCIDLLTFGEIVTGLDDYYEQLRDTIRKRFQTDIAFLFEWRSTHNVRRA